MSDESAFLSAIAATPEDDVRRLAFADWLDDRDDFRSEYVRAAIAFDRTPPHDIARVRLGERLRELISAPAFKTWLPAPSSFKWGWRRGLLALSVDTPRLQAEPPTEFADWLASNWIERVTFDGHTFGSQPDWGDTFGLVHNARELHFGTDDHGPDALTRLREWPHLRELSLCYLGGRRAWAELAALPHLRVLKLHRPDWTMMPALGQARLPDLEVLDLNKEWEGDLPHWAASFPKLRALTLTQYNAYPDEQCERFAECEQLRHLGFCQKYLPFTRVGLKVLAKLTELRSLVLGPLPRGTIAELSRASKLEYLATYGRTPLVRGLESLTQLRWLSLGAGTLTQGLSAQLLGLPHLVRLDLSFEAFEAGAIAALARAPALRILTASIPDDLNPLGELAGCGQLHYLRVKRRRLAPHELHTLRAALPGCWIDHGAPDPDDDDYDWS